MTYMTKSDCGNAERIEGEEKHTREKGRGKETLWRNAQGLMEANLNKNIS